MIEARRQQLHFGEGLIAEEVADLREDWMKHVDQVLEDEQLVTTVYEALARRNPKSRTRGRRGTPAEVVLRLMLLKHIRNWSYGVLEREVRANLVYRDFTRVGAAKAPDAKTMGRWGLALGPESIEKKARSGVSASRRTRDNSTAPLPLILQIRAVCHNAQGSTGADGDALRKGRD
jgi:IS5 family transposase